MNRDFKKTESIINDLAVFNYAMDDYGDPTEGITVCSCDNMSFDSNSCITDHYIKDRYDTSLSVASPHLPTYNGINYGDTVTIYGDLSDKDVEYIIRELDKTRKPIGVFANSKKFVNGVKTECRKRSSINESLDDWEETNRTADYLQRLIHSWGYRASVNINEVGHYYIDMADGEEDYRGSLASRLRGYLEGEYSVEISDYNDYTLYVDKR